MRFVSSLCLVLVLTATAVRAEQRQLPTPAQILAGLGFSEADKQAVFSGEIVAIDLPTILENQLKGAVAMRVSASLDRAAAFFMSEQKLAADATITTFGVVHPSASESDWQGVRFGPADRDEVKRILEGRPASILNLSPEEAVTLTSRLNGITPEQPEAAEALSEVYRDILAGRYGSYLEGGLDAIPPYGRGGHGKALPAEEFRADLTAASFSVLEAFPDFRRSILDFPRNHAPGVANSFYWIRATVEGRPHYALAHQMALRGDGFLVVYSRDYFAGHTYNTLQSTFLWLADDRGLFAVHVNAGTTDEITGFFSGIAREVGKKRMKEDLIVNFTEVRDRLTR